MHGQGQGAGAERARKRLAEVMASSPARPGVTSRQQYRRRERKAIKANDAIERATKIRNRRHRKVAS